MDDATVPRAVFEQTLRQLARLNRLTGGHRPTLYAMRRFTEGWSGARPIRVLDVGCGEGDALRFVARWAARRGVRVEGVGLDRSPWALTAAQRAPDGDPPLRFICADVLAYEPEEPFDVILSSLFAHHLDDDQLRAFCAWMCAHARLGWFINDLQRHWFSWAIARFCFPLCGFSRMICTDGPISVSRGFRRADLAALAAACGFPATRVEIRRHWPFRYGMLYM